MSTMSDIIDYRNKIMSKFINSPTLIELIDPLAEGDEESLLYEKIFPYEYIPDIIESANTYLFFDLDVDLNKRNSVINNFTLYVYPVSHVGAMRTSKGLKPDLMAVEIEKLFKGQNVLGVGEMSLVYNHRYHAGEGFRGRVMCFRIYDFVNPPKIPNAK